MDGNLYRDLICIGRAIIGPDGNGLIQEKYTSTSLRW